MESRNDVDMLAATTKAQEPGSYVDLLQTPYSDAFAFADTERRALELYDQLLELELQLALLQAQSAHSSDNLTLSDDELQEQLTLAEREAMDAKAEYEIRNRITHNVLVMDPVLKAVHGGEQTGHAEKRMLPMLAERDTVNMVHNTLSTKFVSLQRDISSAERGNIVANSQNRELSVTMLALAEDMKAQSTRDIQDPRLREQVTSVETELKESRRRMKTLKGILSAMIVSSGINWAADEDLVELVMDDEDD